MPVAEHHALPGLEPEQVEQVAKAAAFADFGGLQGEAGLATHDRVVKEGAQPRVARTDLFGHGLPLEARTAHRARVRASASESERTTSWSTPSFMKPSQRGSA